MEGMTMNSSHRGPSRHRPISLWFALVIFTALPAANWSTHLDCGPFHVSSRSAAQAEFELIPWSHLSGNCAPDCALTDVHSRQTSSLTGEHGETRSRSEVVKAAAQTVLRSFSASPPPSAFQACSIDLSDISPFRI